MSDTNITAMPGAPKQAKTWSAWFPVLFFILFSLAFILFFQDATPYAKDLENQEILSIFQKYGRYMGVAFGFLSLIIMYILYGLKKLVRLGRFTFINPFLAAAAFLPWFLFGRQLVYSEPRYTDIARALIDFLGDPLITATAAMFAVAGFWLVIKLVLLAIRALRAKKIPTTTAGAVVLLLFAPFLLSGCVGELMLVMCDFFPDSDHCFQGGAIQEGQSAECEKITGEKFADIGSNPPRDKCYLLIAENTGDLSACDQIQGGPMSYTREECILGSAVKNMNPEGCLKLSGADKAECVRQLGPKLDPGAVVEIDDQIAILKEELKKGADPALEAQLKGLMDKKEGYLGVMSPENKAMYEALADPNNRAASLDYHLGKIDQETRDTLVALNDKLRGQGESMKPEEYQAIRDLLAYKNDPRNDVENMDISSIVKLRWNEKLGNAVDYFKFWNANPSKAEEQLDEQLLFYERMMERQAAIDKGMSELRQDADRNLGMVTDYLKDKAWEKGTEEAQKAAFGELMDLVESDASGAVTAVLGEAIDTVKKEAKSAEFRGLVRAYNMGMAEELGKAGGNVERAHAAVVANLQKDAYTYEDKDTFAKYGNILENKDCDGSNPHCIKRDIFWKSMKKSYEYQHSGT